MPEETNITDPIKETGTATPAADQQAFEEPQGEAAAPEGTQPANPARPFALEHPPTLPSTPEKPTRGRGNEKDKAREEARSRRFRSPSAASMKARWIFCST